MMTVGKWRWPLILALPLAAGALLARRGWLRPVYESRSVLELNASLMPMGEEIKRLGSEEFRMKVAAAAGQPAAAIRVERIAGSPTEVVLTAQGTWPRPTREVAQTAARLCLESSAALRKAEIRRKLADFTRKAAGLAPRLESLIQERQKIYDESARPATDAPLTERLRALSSRRRTLRERFPGHSDIPILSKLIREVEARLQTPAPVDSERLNALGRQIVEAGIQGTLISRRLQELSKAEQGLKPAWAVVEDAREPRRPVRVKGGLVGGEVSAVLFLLGLLVFKGRVKPGTAPDGLWKPQMEIALHAARPPMDPLDQQAAVLYGRCFEITKTLYAPVPEPPSGILESFEPLWRESVLFLRLGREVLTRHLARKVEPGDLVSHVTHTVFMAIMGGEEAGLSAEHQLGLALAALFHDLAVVPRLPADGQGAPEGWAEVGSEVGRLSAALVRKIPGLPPARSALIEAILIGMDEYKQEVWQNVSQNKNLESLSALLRQIDRFEKVMQKQKSRLERRQSAGLDGEHSIEEVLETGPQTAGEPAAALSIPAGEVRREMDRTRRELSAQIDQVAHTMQAQMDRLGAQMSRQSDRPRSAAPAGEREQLLSEVRQDMQGVVRDLNAHMDAMTRSIESQFEQITRQRGHETLPLKPREELHALLDEFRASWDQGLSAIGQKLSSEQSSVDRWREDLSGLRRILAEPSVEAAGASPAAEPAPAPETPPQKVEMSFDLPTGSAAVPGHAFFSRLMTYLNESVTEPRDPNEESPERKSA